MEDNGLRQLKYLIDSHKAWKPQKLAVLPWEAGLAPKHEVKSVIERTTAAIQRVMGNEESMDN